MSAALALLRWAAPWIVSAGLGFGAAWSWQGSRAEARVLAIEARERQALLDQASAWRKEIERRQALADDIDRRAAARDRALTTQLQETQHALKTATRGRPCLGGAALRLLDQSTGLRAPEPAGALHGRAAAAAADSKDNAENNAEGEAFASDTDVAGWIALAGDYYERCRARIRDIREWEHGGGGR